MLSRYIGFNEKALKKKNNADKCGDCRFRQRGRFANPLVDSCEYLCISGVSRTVMLDKNRELVNARPCPLYEKRGGRKDGENKNLQEMW